jgi:hypothetical protein
MNIVSRTDAGEQVEKNRKERERERKKRKRIDQKMTMRMGSLVDMRMVMG